MKLGLKNRQIAKITKNMSSKTTLTPNIDPIDGNIIIENRRSDVEREVRQESWELEAIREILEVGEGIEAREKKNSLSFNHCFILENFLLWLNFCRFQAAWRETLRSCYTVCSYYRSSRFRH